MPNEDICIGVNVRQKKKNVAVPFITLVTGREKENDAKSDEFDRWCF